MSNIKTTYAFQIAKPEFLYDEIVFIRSENVTFAMMRLRDYLKTIKYSGWKQVSGARLPCLRIADTADSSRGLVSITIYKPVSVLHEIISALLGLHFPRLLRWQRLDMSPKIKGD